MTTKFIKNLNRGFLSLFLILSVILIHTSCTVTNDISYQEREVSVDLTNYSQQGFFITTGDLSGNYSSISIIEVYCRSGITKEEKQSKKNFEDDIYRDREKIIQNYKDCEIEHLIDNLVSQAKSKGANGIISLKIDREEVSNNGLLQEVVKVSGLAIKNK